MIIGLDVGGTHTDVVLWGNRSIIREVKVPTDPVDLFTSVLRGIEDITRNINIKDINRIVLSTTLITNAVVQKKIPSVGMIVSSGPGIDPELFRTGTHYYPVSGSIDHRGREIEPVDESAIKKLINPMIKAGIKSVGVVSKFSIRNPAHELKINKIIKDSFDSVFLGHRVSGSLNFPRRIATTFINASVAKIHKDFFIAIKKSLGQKKLNLPIHILKADGGTMSFEASIDFPGQTVLSGPAASVMGALSFAPKDSDSLVLDIGGTTTDMAVLVNRVAALNPLGIELGGYKTLIRSIEAESIGIGGDSLVRIKDGKLKVGPQREGFAIAHGGTEPTLTDAFYVLENMDIEKKSIKGIAPLAEKLGLSVSETSEKIIKQACETIYKRAQNLINRINSKPVYTVKELHKGFMVNPKKILVLGGPAPFFAKRLKQLFGFPAMVVPKCGIANAMGAALSKTTCEVTLFADTQQGVVMAPEENFAGKISGSFTKKDAVKKAYELLEKKALQRGAQAGELEMEIIEEMEFNMIRGFSTAGKNIRIKAQIKPGLIEEYDHIARV